VLDGKHSASFLTLGVFGFSRSVEAIMWHKQTRKQTKLTKNNTPIKRLLKNKASGYRHGGTRIIENEDKHIYYVSSIML
jgi:hypothetical protein